jgi:RNA polymerase sigma-70 factor (ECF subfamily)
MDDSRGLRAASDGELARRVAAREGDAPLAEGELCRRLGPRVRLYGLRHLRDEAAADDLVQDVLLMTMDSLRAGRVRAEDRLVSFVLGSCRRMAADRRRGARRRERLLERFAGDLVPAPPQTAAPLDLDRLERCLAALPERDRSVVVAGFYEERSSGEVASALGLSPANVRVVRHRALGRLRRCMETAS